MTNPLIYLAGPMRGIPGFNFPAFFDAEEQLENRSIDVISPARHDVESGLFSRTDFTGNEDLSKLGFDLRAALTWDLEQVLRADFVVLLPGWRTSSGTCAEVAAAKAAGIPVVEYAVLIEELDSYSDSQPDADYQVLTIAGTYIDPWKLANEREARVIAEEQEVDNGPAGYVATGKEEEIRVTDPVTGGMKGTKLAQLGSLDPQALYTLAEVSGAGASKYAAFNFLKGYAWSLSFNAMQRHLLKFWAGEDLDADDRLPHLAHAAWHCLALLAFYQRQLGTDDRFVQPTTPASMPASLARGLAQAAAGQVEELTSVELVEQQVDKQFVEPEVVIDKDGDEWKRQGDGSYAASEYTSLRERTYARLWRTFGPLRIPGPEAPEPAAEEAAA